MYINDELKKIKNQKLKRYLSEKENILDSLKKIEKDIEICESIQKIVTAKDLIQDLEINDKKDCKYLEIEVSMKEYLYILGGDGRSQSWDEKRTGKVFKAILKKKFIIKNDELEHFHEYLKKTQKVDHIELKVVSYAQII